MRVTDQFCSFECMLMSMNTSPKILNGKLMSLAPSTWSQSPCRNTFGYSTSGHLFSRQNKQVNGVHDEESFVLCLPLAGIP